MPTTIEQSVDVNVPVRTAYNQWTQFEEFPEFMEAVEEVKQIDDTHLRWKAESGGTSHEWEAEITEQHPDERIAWTSTSGKGNSGVVTFHRLDDETTRIMLQLEWEPEGAKEQLGSAVGLDDRSVKGDLERFKQLIERRGTESGAWRGEVDQTTTR
jgi:uncharacterized membrane protein